MPFDVTIEAETQAARVEIGGLVALAERVMAGEECSHGTSLSCLLVDDAAIRALNRQFLGLDEPTDVLAFPDEPDSEFVEGHEAGVHLGDIAISMETASAQARLAGHGLREELAHLLVHGILHLCGYDHAAGPAEEARMQSREEHYLRDSSLHA